MAGRTLPKKKNPLVAPPQAPSYDELLSRRRLGKTKLTVKPGQMNTSNATKSENLGPFEYAHLRAPLPDNLKGSEIFQSQPDQSHPETYFLMRRSKDGFVSATGMFKIAFPWAKQEEEKAERDYLKKQEATSHDEVAGNIWIEPTYALELADAYGLSEWVRALLDPADIIQSPSSAKKQIAPPPKFDLPLKEVKLPAPGRTPGRGGKKARSVSPSKIASPTKSTASPRKRQTKAQKEAATAATAAANSALQSALDDAASTSTAVEPQTPATSSPTLNGSASDMVKVEVEQSVDHTGKTETTHTNVTIEMPAGSPELPLPQDTEKMLETAKRMVEEAKTLESSPKITRKRKVEEIDPSDIDKELPPSSPPAKKARVLEEKLKREKVRTRAFVGVAAALGVAAAIPYFF